MSESIAPGGNRPPQPLEHEAETETRKTALACDNLREDHRRIEACLDRLLAVLQRLSAGGIREVQSIVDCIQHLSAAHFEKEEKILYPRLRPIQPELLDQMDRQHCLVREVEMSVTEMLADPPQAPDARWLNELRRVGIEFHDHIQHHIVDEEDHLFRVAEDHLTVEEQASLAGEMVVVQERMACGKDPAEGLASG
jgi:hemerythrin-like domain-containing protein